MEFESVGRNIRKFRKERHLRLEQLAEMTGLSTNYVGSIERGEKVPSFESFVTIINALGVSADMVLTGVVKANYKVNTSLLVDRIEGLPDNEKLMVSDVIETLLGHISREN